MIKFLKTFTMNGQFLGLATRKLYLYRIFLGILLIPLVTGKGATEPVLQGTTEQTTIINYQHGETMRYLLYIPRGYDSTGARWPLLLYLHGGLGRGDDFEKMKWYPLPKMMARNDTLPFIVIAPQCPEGTMWINTGILMALVDSICSRYAVDTNRIYLAGYSMGGAGVWLLAYAYPNKFAAIAPMSGWTTKFYADHLVNTPVWVFHGADDSTVTINETEEIIRILREKKAEIKTSIVPGRGHRPPSDEEHWELFNWMLQQRRYSSDSGYIK